MQVEQIVEKLQVASKLFFGHLIDVAEQAQALYHRHIPPQLGLLAEYGANLAGVLHAILVWHESVHFDLTARWHENATQHFDGCGFARAIWTDITNEFAFT